MSCKAVILAVLLCGLVSRASSTKCLSCTEAARPRDCQYVEECGIHEKCFIESYITVLGDIRYNVGCMDGMKCAAAGRKRDVFNATVLNVVQQKNDFGADPEEQSDQTDAVVCSECCNTELCNIKGCGEEGLPPNSGLLCYACEQEVAPDKCNKIALCSRDSICNRLGVLDIGAYQLVGRRSFDEISRFQRGTLCNKCCTRNLCNIDNCTSLISHSATVAPAIQATTTLAPVNGGWGTWSHWNLCSATCGGGHHFRYRPCSNPAPANAGAPCIGLNKETQICNNQLCAVDWNWSDWGLWSACSATCGSSVTRSRTRTCTNPSSASGDANCIGMSTDVESCNIGSCPVDGNWYNWGPWSDCTATCGSFITRSRTRDCTNPAPSAGGANCIGTRVETMSCNLGACPVDGNWYYWGPWSYCTATCGSYVTRSRTRDCTNPAPSPGGANCIGTRVETMSCNLGECPVDGQWSSWTTWSSCSVTCGTGGTSIRQRNCDNPRPSATGLFCSGDSYESRQCSGSYSPQIIPITHNYSRPLGSQVVIKCFDHVEFPLQVIEVRWTVPQIVGRPIPSNLQYINGGSLLIHELRPENCGPYFCTLITNCGSYKLPDFYVATY